MPNQLPNPMVKKIQKGAPATAATLNEPLIEVDENFEDVDTKIQDLNTKMDRVQDQLSINLDNEETEDLTVDKNLYVGEDLVVSKNATIEGTLSASMDEAKSYLVPEVIYPSDWNKGSVWSTDYTQQTDGQWIWNDEPTETAGRHYFYNPNGVWREPILNPAIGAHLGGDRIQFRSLKKLDHSAHDGRPIYEVSGLQNVRYVGSHVVMLNNNHGVGIDDQGTIAFGNNGTLEIIGYFNDFKMLTMHNDSGYLGDTAIEINGVLNSKILNKNQTSITPISNRYLPANINILPSGDMGITLGVNSLSLKRSTIEQCLIHYLSGIELIVNKTTLQIPAQKAVVQGKVVSLPASTPAYKPAAQTTDIGQVGEWDNPTDIANGAVNFNGGRVVHYLKPGSDTLQTRVNWMPANAKYQEAFSWATGVQVSSTIKQSAPCVLKEGNNYICYYAVFNKSEATDGIWRFDIGTDPTNTAWGTPSGSRIIPEGTEGTYDTATMNFPTVYYDGASSYFMIYEGYNGSKYTFICAESSDGISWSNFNLLLDLGVSGSSDDYAMYSPHLLKVGGKWYLYYIGHDGSKFRLHLATSTATLPRLSSDWTRHGVILGLGVSGDLDDNQIRDCSVLYDNGIFKMLYSGQDGTNERLLYATSKDSFVWTKHGLHKDIGSGGSFDDGHISGSTWLIDGSTYHMWYAGYDGEYTLGYTSSPIVTGINQQTYGAYSNSIHNGYVPEHGNLTMSDQEEIARVFHWREFGNGDKNGATSHGFDTLSGSVSSRAFVLDDGGTGIVGKGVVGSPELYVDYNSGNNSTTLTFKGVGVGINITRLTDEHEFYIDGDLVKTQSNLSNNDLTSQMLTIASNLPYGFHTLKIHRTEGLTNNMYIQEFVIFQPKAPPIPEGSVVVSDYMLFAEPKQITNADILKINKGATRVNATREIKYDGIAVWQYGAIEPDEIGGVRITSSGSSHDEASISFFGNEVSLRFQANNTGRASAIDVYLSNDGGSTFNKVNTTNLAALWGGNANVATTNGMYDEANGQFTQVAGAEEHGHSLCITGLDLDSYVFKYEHNTAGAYYIQCSGIDYHCPIGRPNHYSPWKSRNPLYDELIGGGGLDTDDLIVGPNLITKDEVNRGVVRKPQIYGIVWRNLGQLNSGSIYLQNQVRGTYDYKTHAKVKGVATDCYNGGFIVLKDGLYEIGGFVTGYSGYATVYAGTHTVQYVRFYSSSHTTSPIFGEVILKKGDSIRLARNDGSILGNNVYHGALTIKYLGEK